MKRICFVTEEFYPITSGGIGKLIHNLVLDTLSRTDEIDIHLLVPSTSNISEERLRSTLLKPVRVHSFASGPDDAEKRDSENIYPITTAFTDTPWHAQSLAILLALKSLAKEGLEFDVIEFPDHLGWGFCTIQEKRLGGISRRTRVAVRIHTTQGILQHFEEYRVRMVELGHAELERKALEDAELVIAHSEPVADFNARFYGFDEQWRSKVMIQRPPVRLTGPGTQDSRTASKARNLVFPTKLAQVKRPDLFVRASAQLMRRCNQFVGQAILACHAPDAAYLRRITGLIPSDLTHRFEFFDSMSESDRQRLLAENIVVIPSDHESLSLAAYEAAFIGGTLILNGKCAAFGDRTPFVDQINCFKFDGSVDGLTDTLERAWSSSSPMTPIEYQSDRQPYYELDGTAEAPAAVPKPSGRVSVVITNYNLGEYLPETLQSVAASSYQDVEVIIVDDGSSAPLDARLLGELEAESKRDARLKLIRNPVNRGLAGARNIGVRAATGEYVLPLDADDRISATFIELGVRALKREPEFDVVVPTAAYFSRDEDLDAGRFIDYAVFLGNAVSFGLVANRFSCATSLMRRKLFDHYSYNEELTSYEDWDLYLRLAMAGHRFLVTNDIHFFYRRRPDSMIRQLTRTRHFDLLARIYESLPEIHRGTRLASVLAPILELLDETGGLTHDEALAQLQDEVGQLRSLVMGKPLRYKVVDALNQQVKRLPFLHRALKAPLSTRGPKL